MIWDPEHGKHLINTNYFITVTNFSLMLLVSVQRTRKSLCMIENVAGSYFQFVCKAALMYRKILSGIKIRKVCFRIHSFIKIRNGLDIFKTHLHSFLRWNGLYESLVGETKNSLRAKHICCFES